MGKVRLDLRQKKNAAIVQFLTYMCIYMLGNDHITSQKGATFFLKIHSDSHYKDNIFVIEIFPYVIVLNFENLREIN